MSSSVNVIPLRRPDLRAPLPEDLLDTIAAADDLGAAVVEVVTQLTRTPAVDGAEWWTPADDGLSLRLELSAGDTSGARTTISIGPPGTLVLAGEGGAGLEPTIARLRPALRRRWSEEQLATHAARLARRNEALEDCAALVAHDVRASLVYALRSDEPREGLARAIELVDSILEAVGLDDAGGGGASAADCVHQAVADLGEVGAEVVTTVTGDVPIPPAALRIVLRNLLANAVAAGAHRVHVSALGGGDRRALVVDDDGVGLGSTDGYATGAGLGVALCRRLLSRFGGLLELKPRADGGTRAVILVAGADE